MKSMSDRLKTLRSDGIIFIEFCKLQFFTLELKIPQFLKMSKNLGNFLDIYF